MRKRIVAGFAVSIAAVFGLTAAASSATLHTSDFIDNNTRTNFAGFESLEGSINLGPTHLEDGIKIEQINGETNDIWSTYDYWGPEGSRSWYPNGGDYGYTKISLASGLDFINVGFLHGSGWGSTQGLHLQYTLLDDDVVIQSGDFVVVTFMAQYLGFSGGGFDTIWLSDYVLSSDFDSKLNALALDSIEVSGGNNPVPEPTTMLLFGAGLAGLAAARRRKKVS